MNRVIEFGFYLLLALVPLVMTPFNFELFEFNKMLVVYALTTVIIAAWLVKMVRAQKIIFRRTFLDIPLLIFLISQFLSFYLSIAPHTSLWGYYSRFHGGLVSILAFSLLYWAYVSNMNRQKTLKAIQFALISAGLVAIYGIAERFGIDAEYWVQDVQTRVFSTLGQPNWLAAYLVALLPLTWSLALKDPKPVKYYLLSIISYSALLFTHSRSGFLGFLGAYSVFWGLTAWLKRRKLQLLTKPWLTTTITIISLTAIIGTPWSQPSQKPAPDEPQLISDSGDIRKIVWQGAVNIWRNYPILGTGPETFAYSYYWHRPQAHNDLSEWDFLYNKAHNEYLNYAANTGTIGLISYLALIVTFLIVSLKKLISKKNLSVALLAGFISILITNFFGFSTVTVNLLFFLLPAMVISLQNQKLDTKEKPLASLSLPQKLALISVLLFVIHNLTFIGRTWLADYYFAKAERFNKTSQYDFAFNDLQRAINLRPNEPTYHSEISLSSAHLAVLSDQQKDTNSSADFTETAVNEINRALQISPYNLNFWKNRTKVFYNLAEINEGYLQEALASILQATELAPTDPKLHYNLALIYAQLGQEETAIQTLEKTIELKPNYEDARYALALFYEGRNQPQKAQEQLQYIINHINPQSEKAQKQLD